MSDDLLGAAFQPQRYQVLCIISPPAYIGHKIATIILSHDCDEDPCHLNNDEQGRWIRSTLPMDKLRWNWNLKTIKVYNVSREAEDPGTSDYIAKVVQTEGGDERKEFDVY